MTPETRRRISSLTQACWDLAAAAGNVKQALGDESASTRDAVAQGILSIIDVIELEIDTLHDRDPL